MQMKKNILLVEYSSGTLELLKETFRNKLFHVDIAGSEEEAKKYLSKRQYQLLITATLLPKSHGFILSKFVSENYPQTRIIIISEQLKEEDHRKEAIDKYGASDFFEKPLIGITLQQRAFQLLGLKDDELPEYEDTANMSTNIHLLPTLQEVAREKGLGNLDDTNKDLFGEMMDEIKENPQYNIDLD